MTWPAGSRFGVALIAAVACVGSKKPEATVDNRAQALEQDSAAAYLCSIEDGGYVYPQFACAIREIDGQLVLAKLGGSQRFRGVIEMRGRGFTFDGELYCPWGDCTQPLHGVFEPTGREGALRGRFRDASIVVNLFPAPANSAWGGATYGGDSYGGSGYGGWGYGGATYGRPLERRNHRP